MWVSLSAWLALGAVAGASSVPHCVGMCGPLAAAACPKGAGAAAPLRYQAGRVVSYAALGAIAGALGHTLRWGLPGAWGSALLSWALAAGLGLSAYRAFESARAPTTRRSPEPADALIPLRRGRGDAPQRPAGPVRRAAHTVIARPFALGLVTALLPCGALAAALLVAAGTGVSLGGALVMSSFAAVSGLGLIAAAWLLQRAPTGPGPARVLAVVLALGAVIFALRPVHALRTGGAAACPAHEVAAASDSARGQPGAHPAHPPAAEMASMR